MIDFAFFGYFFAHLVIGPHPAWYSELRAAYQEASGELQKNCSYILSQKTSHVHFSSNFPNPILFGHFWSSFKFNLCQFMVILYSMTRGEKRARNSNFCGKLFPHDKVAKILLHLNFGSIQRFFSQILVIF